MPGLGDTMRKSDKNSKYQIFRSLARKMSLSAIADDPNMASTGLDIAQIRLDPITAEAIDASYLWGESANLYPWEDVPRWKEKDSRGFDLSIWFGPELCGLCYASPRQSTICIKVILLEGKPDRSHPLRGLVASFSLLAIDKYARMLGCTKIEIQDPDPGAIPLYQKLGFAFDKDDHLVMSVSPD